jgi:hypothetical protein
MTLNDEIQWATQEEADAAFRAGTLTPDAISRRAMLDAERRLKIWKNQEVIKERAERILQWTLDQDPESVLDINDVHVLAHDALTLLEALRRVDGTPEHPNGTEALTGAERIRLEQETDPRD